MNYFESIENKVRNLIKLKKWEEILDLSLLLSSEEKISYLWCWPTKINLEFIKNVLNNYEINSILSIGCGTGLLEWIIQESTGINVYGIESDQLWWDSDYSIKPFINLNFVNKDNLTSEFLKKSAQRTDWKFALLFCYFNNRKAFLEYMKVFKGNCVIIIGPDASTHKYTDPDPFDPQFDENDQWILTHYSEILSSKDFIMFYMRKK